MNKAKIQRLKQFYETPEERRKFLKYLKNVDAIISKNPNYTVYGLRDGSVPKPMMVGHCVY